MSSRGHNNAVTFHWTSYVNTLQWIYSEVIASWHYETNGAIPQGTLKRSRKEVRGNNEDLWLLIVDWLAYRTRDSLYGDLRKPWFLFVAKGSHGAAVVVAAEVIAPPTCATCHDTNWYFIFSSWEELSLCVNNLSVVAVRKLCYQAVNDVQNTNCTLTLSIEQWQAVKPLRVRTNNTYIIPQLPSDIFCLHL